MDILTKMELEKLMHKEQQWWISIYLPTHRTLFLPLGVQEWGVFDQETHKIVCHDPGEPGDEPLLDLLAVQTYFKGGVVNVMAPEDIPGGTDTAAVLRY